MISTGTVQRKGMPVTTAPMDLQIYMGTPSMQVTFNPYSTTTGNLRSKSESQKWRKPLIRKFPNKSIALKKVFSPISRTSSQSELC